MLGVFPHAAGCAKAIRHLREEGFRDLLTYSPVPDHEIEEALGEPPSPVRFFTLSGAIIGGVAGFGLTIGTSVAWPLLTGGKPIVAMPTFVVIAFETTILLAALGTLLGLLVNARLPSRETRSLYEPRFSGDRFGLFIHCDATQTQAAVAILRSAEAEEVKVAVV
ncbi:MAG: DUF3341 domain-containing protein [Nitrospinae bacterium]|nr:DUF3341 domain-containing protein [Nitrospinota bacterium]